MRWCGRQYTFDTKDRNATADVFAFREHQRQWHGDIQPFRYRLRNYLQRILHVGESSDAQRNARNRICFQWMDWGL